MFETSIVKSTTIPGYEAVFSWRCPLCGLHPRRNLDELYYRNLVWTHLINVHNIQGAFFTIQVKASEEDQIMNLTFTARPPDLETLVRDEVKRQLDARRGLGK